MPDRKYLSKFTFPNGQTYYLKDEEARQLIGSGGTFIIAWNGTGTPDVSKIPAGIVVNYGGTAYTGTLAATDPSVQSKGFYLVKSSVGDTAAKDTFDEYVIVNDGSSVVWERLGNTALDVSSLKSLAYKDNVTLQKGTGKAVLGASTTFTAAESDVTFTGGTTKTALGAGATFKTAVDTTKTAYTITSQLLDSPTVNKTIDTFVKSYPGETSKLDTVKVPNLSLGATSEVRGVSNVGSASTWEFNVNEDSETLVISGANGVAPTLADAVQVQSISAGEEITVASGTVSAEGTGSSIMTGLGAAVTAEAASNIEVSMDTVRITSSFENEGSRVSEVYFVTDVPGATTTVETADNVVAVTSVGTGKAAAQVISVGNNDSASVPLFDDLDVVVS